MNSKLGEKIKQLRKQKSISQEVLAQYLGVSFQAVSKWETGATMPDVMLIPSLASFFDVTTDELFDFNLWETEQKVEQICDEAYQYRFCDPAKSEQILRDGLKQFPSNDIILNNLLVVIQGTGRKEEVVDLCKALIEGSKLAEIRYDALRILAETYKDMGEMGLVKSTLEQIPEFYFTRLQLEAELLVGKERYRAASIQKDQSADMFVDMCWYLMEYYEESGEVEKGRQQLILAGRVLEVLQEDPAGQYLTEMEQRWRAEMMEKIKEKLRGDMT